MGDDSDVEPMTSADVIDRLEHRRQRGPRHGDILTDGPVTGPVTRPERRRYRYAVGACFVEMLDDTTSRGQRTGDGIELRVGAVPVGLGDQQCGTSPTQVGALGAVDARQRPASSSSSTLGCAREATMPVTPAAAAATEGKNATAVLVRIGRGRSRTVASTTTPSVPSAPTNSAVRS